MKNILLTILGMIMFIPQLSFAEDEAELIWRTDRLGGNESISDVEVSNTREVFYNVLDNIVQIRNILDGVVLETITFNNNFEVINGISITNDDRYMAISGDNPNLIIWDLVTNQEYKRLTKVIFENESADYWKSVSFSPDGSKLSAIGVKEFSSTVTELVVFDIETEDVILSESRNNMDKINQVYYGPKWLSTEFSPSGEYLVTELSVNWDHQSGQVVLDSVYVYGANNFEIKDVFSNNHDEKDISFTSYENVISSSFGNTLTIYNLDTRVSKSKTFNSYPNSVVFSRKNNYLITKIGQSVPNIYDYNEMDTTYSYEANFLGVEVTLDNKYIISNGNGALSLVHATWDGVTNVNQIGKEINILYPNPTDSNLNLEIYIENDGTFSYQIFDMNSNLVLSDELSFFTKW